MARLDGKTALITGGESGIGLATAELFVTEGARVHLLGIDEARLRDASDRLGDAVTFAVADVRNEAAVASGVEAGTAALGGYDVVFSNAGIGGTLDSIPEADTTEVANVLNVHVMGAFHVLKHTIPHMADGGSIIINSSVSGLVGFPNSVAYTAAKHAQIGIMRVAAKELAPRRIRVNTVHPGPTTTALQDDLEVKFTGQDLGAAREFFDGLVPLGRHMTPGEIANAVLFLASDESVMITATLLPVDGGLRG